MGHRNEGVGIFPRLLQLGAQRPDLFFDLPMIFACFPLAFCWTDQPFREQRQNGVEDLLATGLRPQDSARLFHLAAFLSIAVSTALEQMCFNLLPGKPTAISG